MGLQGKDDTQGWERGAALVEMALVLPLLLMLLLGIFTTARAWNVHNILDHAAREAARYGATDPDPAAIQTVAQGVVVSASYPWAEVTPCVAIGSGTLGCISSGTGSGEDPTSDDRVQVTLSIDDYPLNFVFWETTVDLTAKAVARLEP